MRRDAPSPDLPEFDIDETLHTALAMSRLIRPHGAGCEWALRVIDDPMAERVRLVPVTVENGFLAYVVDRTARDWLDQAEAEQLRSLLDRYWKEEPALPERIRHALWISESVSRQGFLDIALPLVVTGVEALVHTDRNDSHQQFVDRAGALAIELGVQGLDAAALGAVYKDRSKGTHGTRVRFEDDPDAAARFGRVHRLLQTAVRWGIEDRSFRAKFADDARMAAALSCRYLT